MVEAGGQAVFSKKRNGVRASIYLLPNMITATSLFCGFLAIKMSIDGRMASTPDAALMDFVNAAYLILIAGVADGLDGSVARWTRTQSAFGVQFDSLSDLVSFGVAPAMVAYNFALHNIGRLGLGAAFVFAACGALRLARFNVQSAVGKASGNFTGIPIPMAAAPVAVYILAYATMNEWLIDVGSYSWQKSFAELITKPSMNGMVLAIILLVLGLGMISTFEYISTKTLKLPRKHPFRMFGAILITFILLFSLDFTVTMTILMLAYCVHGPILWLFWKRDRGDEEEALFASPEDEEEETEKK
jgi:CDP-diacylglycerol--serine O-phosphatidyltransferase